ncbi:MAG: sulfurtransferase TusA family protein [Defluviitaleaceae bacterium]|nr:sulfurtransferase TusA family protein [Defluviitaleaceae bacterium]
MTTLDARGISCPEPLIMLKKALKSQTPLTLLVDSKNAYENCELFAKKQGFVVTVQKDSDAYTLHIGAEHE